MATKNTGGRFRLLLYERRIHRYRRPALTLASLLLVLAYLANENMLDWPAPASAPALVIGGIASLLFWLFTLIAPHMAYAQPRRNYLHVQTPFFRLKIAYQRIHNTRPIDFAKMFPPSTIRRGDRWLLRPFFGATALGIDLVDWPVRPSLLRIFLSRYFLAPDQPTFVLLVEDWMALSNQLSTLIDAWRTPHRERPRRPGFSARDILQDDR